jgi:hypothetical protein
MRRYGQPLPGRWIKRSDTAADSPSEDGSGGPIFDDIRRILLREENKVAEFNGLFVAGRVGFFGFEVPQVGAAELNAVASALVLRTIKLAFKSVPGSPCASPVFCP